MLSINNKYYKRCFLRTIEVKIERNNSRKHIGSKKMPIFERLIHAIYLLRLIN